MALQGIPYASHAVVGREVVELREDLALPVDAIAHPADERQSSVRLWPAVGLLSCLCSLSFTHILGGDILYGTSSHGAMGFSCR